jgi:hypothetical protein
LHEVKACEELQHCNDMDSSWISAVVQMSTCMLVAADTRLSAFSALARSSAFSLSSNFSSASLPMPDASAEDGSRPFLCAPESSSSPSSPESRSHATAFQYVLMLTRTIL